MFVTQWIHKEHSTPLSLHPAGNSPGCSSGKPCSPGLGTLTASSTHLCCAEPWQSPHQLTAFDLLSAFQLLSSCVSLHQVLGPHSVIFMLFLSAFCFPFVFQISQMCHLSWISQRKPISGLAVHTLSSHIAFLRWFSNEVSLLAASVPALHFRNSVVLKWSKPKRCYHISLRSMS